MEKEAKTKGKERETQIQSAMQEAQIPAGATAMAVMIVDGGSIMFAKVA